MTRFQTESRSEVLGGAVPAPTPTRPPPPPRRPPPFPSGAARSPHCPFSLFPSHLPLAPPTCTDATRSRPRPVSSCSPRGGAPDGREWVSSSRSNRAPPLWDGGTFSPPMITTFLQALRLSGASREGGAARIALLSTLDMRRTARCCGA